MPCATVAGAQGSAGSIPVKTKIVPFKVGTKEGANVCPLPCLAWHSVMEEIQDLFCLESPTRAA